MYEVKAYWAGYVLRHYTQASPAGIEELLQAIEEEFADGIIFNSHGVEMKIKVLCVDVLSAGKIILQKDFKA